MKIVYYSLTGNVKRFLSRSGYQNIISVQEASQQNLFEPFIIMTSTIGFGEVPLPVSEFLEQHHQHLKGVISSGNRNWGQNFGKAGDHIAAKYHVPLLMKYELHGTQQDINEFLLLMEKVEIEHEHSDREKVQSY